MGHGARVVTAAALIMISVFAGFVLIDDPIIKSMGFALADRRRGRRLHRPHDDRPRGDVAARRAGVVAAALADRVLPNVDIEGELRTELNDRAPSRV